MSHHFPWQCRPQHNRMHSASGFCPGAPQVISVCKRLGMSSGCERNRQVRGSISAEPARARARGPQADKNNLWRAFSKRDFATEPNPPTRRPTRPTPGVRGSHRPRKKARKGPNGARASAAAARNPRREQDNKPPATPRAVTTTAAATQPSPRMSRPACTGEPTYRTTRSRDRSGSRRGSRERKSPSEREAQTTKGRPWQTP